MRLLMDSGMFRELFAQAQKLALVDSGRDQATLNKLVFDDAHLSTPEFLNLLQWLMRLSGDTRVYFLVLSPDPVHYFHHHFRKYPLLEIGRDDSVRSYLDALHEDPGGSPADAIGTNWAASVIFPPGAKWFIHLTRSASDDGGHLWISGEWAERAIADHSYLRAELN